LVSSVGPTTGTYPASGGSVVVSAFDYRTSKWDALRTRSATGELIAQVPGPAPFLGPGGALEVRLSARSGGLAVYGDVPTVSALARSAVP